MFLTLGSSLHPQVTCAGALWIPHGLAPISSVSTPTKIWAPTSLKTKVSICSYSSFTRCPSSRATPTLRFHDSFYKILIGEIDLVCNRETLITLHQRPADPRNHMKGSFQKHPELIIPTTYPLLLPGAKPPSSFTWRIAIASLLSSHSLFPYTEYPHFSQRDP